MITLTHYETFTEWFLTAFSTEPISEITVNSSPIQFSQIDGYVNFSIKKSRKTVEVVVDGRKLVLDAGEMTDSGRTVDDDGSNPREMDEAEVPIGDVQISNLDELPPYLDLERIAFNYYNRETGEQLDFTTINPTFDKDLTRYDIPVKYSGSSSNSELIDVRLIISGVEVMPATLFPKVADKSKYGVNYYIDIDGVEIDK